MIRMFLEWRIERLIIEIAMLEEKASTLRGLQNTVKTAIHHNGIISSRCQLATAKVKKDILQAKLDNQ